MKNTVVKGLALAGIAAAALVAGAEQPLMMIRLRRPHTESDEQWAKTFTVLRENRAACDEVWFSTGIGVPKMEWHVVHAKRLARYAEQLRRVGIVPSLQFQATLGHSDSATLSEGTDGKTWGGFTGRDGIEGKACNCPRQAAFLAYVREMARLYASFRPGSVWVDDDLRINNHRPASSGDDIGCWCATCLAAFNAETGGSWTREALAQAVRKDPAMYDRWERFSFAGIAEVARIIAEETHKASPETRLAYQHGPWRNTSQLAVFRAMHEATGMPVGSRPGGGAYYDQNPNDQMVKTFDSARQRKRLGNPPWIDAWCPEVETWPRAFASRTAQGLLNEAFAGLAYGMNCLSFLIMDTHHETDEWYGKKILAPLADGKRILDGFRRHNAGALPAGLADATGGSPDRLYRFALAGVPVLPGPGKAYGEVKDDDLSFSISQMSSSKLLDLRRKMDARAGGRLPVVVETPTVGLVVPWAAADGTLRSVAFVNARIDVQEPARIRLRGVPAGVRAGEWQAFHESPVAVPFERDGADALATIPAIAAWNCGWLRIGKADVRD